MFNPLKFTAMSNFGKDLLVFAGGAAIGAAIGILFAPAKGAVTRRKIASTSRSLKNDAINKFEELVESAEELIEEFKENAAEFICSEKESIKQVGK